MSEVLSTLNVTGDDGRVVVVTFISRSGEDIPMNSRYRNTDVKSIGGVPSLQSWTPIEVPKHSKDKYHIVKSHEESRPDLISYQYYKTAELWWIICVANGIVHPLRDVVTGMVLRIPYFSTIYSKVLV